VPEFIDPVFTKTSPIRSFSVIANERFGLVFAKTGSIISGTGIYILTDDVDNVLFTYLLLLFILAPPDETVAQC
jgi:hypothetical protein